MALDETTTFFKGSTYIGHSHSFSVAIAAVILQFIPLLNFLPCFAY